MQQKGRISDSAPVGRTVVCLEVIKNSRTTGKAVSVVATIPGRDGTLIRSWGNLGRSLSTEEGRDLANWVLSSIQNALMAAEGLQGSLPLA